MTVREWFRLSRGELWRRDEWFYADLDRLLTKVLSGEPLDRVESLRPCKLIFQLVEWQRENDVIEAVRRQLDEAMQELGRESARRASLDRYAADICG